MLRRNLAGTAIGTALAVVVGTLTWTAVQSTAAGTDPTLTVTNSGSNLAGGSQATIFDVKNTAPISMVGQTDSTITTSWVLADATAVDSSIIYPEGWTLQYTTNGSTWTSTAPANLGSVQGIRAAGDVSSFGLDASGYQVSANQSSGQLAAPVSFPKTPGGDGYSLTFTPNKALNVWHHQAGTITIECHDRFTGLGCGTANSELTQAIVGYSNTNNSLGAYNNATKKFYTAVRRDADSTLGFLCRDYSGATGAACSTPFIAMGATGLLTDTYDMGASAFEGAAYNATKFYVVDAEMDRLYCLDMTTGARCSNFTVDGFPIANHGDGIAGNWVSDISVIGGKVYYFAGPYFGCVDPSTNPPSNCDSSKPIRTITNKELTSNVATITTSAAHGFIAGDSVLVAGVDNTFNGVYTVAAAGTTTFTYTKTATNVASTAVTNAA
ncbi:MAG: hypothetical protein KGN78_11040, partial [Actinomycetales bacterium]|nr:hypothetical protein [Actinomycetales bacterium]